jgi:hypothetical protein
MPLWEGHPRLGSRHNVTICQLALSKSICDTRLHEESEQHERTPPASGAAGISLCCHRDGSWQLPAAGRAHARCGRRESGQRQGRGDTPPARSPLLTRRDSQGAAQIVRQKARPALVHGRRRQHLCRPAFGPSTARLAPELMMWCAAARAVHGKKSHQQTTGTTRAFPKCSPVADM